MTIDRWNALTNEFDAFVESVGVGPETTTTQVTMHPKRMPVDDIEPYVQRQRLDNPRLQAVARGASDPDYLNLYMFDGGTDPHVPDRAFLWLEPHSQLATWWLINVWRIRQFGNAALRAYKLDELLVAAAAARGLVEAAASLYSDTLKLIDVWERCKAEPPSSAAPVPAAFSDLRELTYEVLGAGRFDTKGRVKDIAEAVRRTNAKTHVQKLAKRGAGTLTEDYDWLCNVVHPSLGALFTFAGPTEVRQTPYEEVRVSFARDPQQVFSERDETVPTAVRRGAITSLEAALPTLESALQVIDDMGLTTQAPFLAPFGYWRRHARPERNDPCPCRSGTKAKACHHAWGQPAPQPPALIPDSAV